MLLCTSSSIIIVLVFDILLLQCHCLLLLCRFLILLSSLLYFTLQNVLRGATLVTEQMVAKKNLTPNDAHFCVLWNLLVNKGLSIEDHAQLHLRTDLKMHAQSCALLLQDLRKNFNACFYLLAIPFAFFFLELAVKARMIEHAFLGWFRDEYLVGFCHVLITREKFKMRWRGRPSSLWRFLSMQFFEKKTADIVCICTNIGCFEHHWQKGLIKGQYQSGARQKWQTML